MFGNSNSYALILKKQGIQIVKRTGMKVLPLYFSFSHCF